MALRSETDFASHKFHFGTICSPKGSLIETTVFLRKLMSCDPKGKVSLLLLRHFVCKPQSSKETTAAEASTIQECCSTTFVCFSVVQQTFVVHPSAESLFLSETNLSENPFFAASKTNVSSTKKKPCISCGGTHLF